MRNGDVLPLPTPMRALLHICGPGKKPTWVANQFILYETLHNKVLKSTAYFITWYKQQFFPAIHVQKLFLYVNINFQCLLLEKSCRNGQNTSYHFCEQNKDEEWTPIREILSAKHSADLVRLLCCSEQKCKSVKGTWK